MCQDSTLREGRVWGDARTRSPSRCAHEGLLYTHTKTLLGKKKKKKCKSCEAPHSELRCTLSLKKHAALCARTAVALVHHRPEVR